MIYYGEHNKRYELGKRIGGGGEGEVFEIVGQSDKVAKIYKPFKNTAERAEKHEKIRSMLAMNLPSGSGGKTFLAWPEDTLSENNNGFVGYVMPRIKGKKPIYCAFLPTEREVLFGKKVCWEYMPKLALNIASMVDGLHKAGVVLGDFNTDNLLVDNDGYITLIDTDSYTISANGRTFKCKAAMGDTLAPELQGRDLRQQNSVFTKESDCFALAIVIFQTLYNGVHPFVIPTRIRGSSCMNPTIVNIADGHSVFSPDAKDNIDLPPLDFLPDYMVKLFKRAFQYDASTAARPETIQNRPSAAEFVSALKKLIAEPTKRCFSNHVYPASYGNGCPWCAVERKKARNAPKPGVISPSHSVHTGNTNTHPSNSNNYTYSYTPDRSKIPLMVLNILTGILFVLLYSNGFTSGAESIMGISISNTLGFLGLTLATLVAVGVLYHVFGEKYAEADEDEAWLWLLTSLLTPVVGFLIGYAAVIALVGLCLLLKAIWPIVLLCLMCWSIANAEW